MAELQAQLAAVQSQLAERAEAEDKAARAEQKLKAMQDALTNTQDALANTSKIAVNTTKLAGELAQSLAAAKTNDGNPLVAMMKDPKMRQLMVSQQKAMFGPLLAKQYADFFKWLNLTPEQSATLIDLMQMKRLAGADAKMLLFNGNADDAQRANVSWQLSTGPLLATPMPIDAADGNRRFVLMVVSEANISLNKLHFADTKTDTKTDKTSLVWFKRIYVDSLTKMGIFTP